MWTLLSPFISEVSLESHWTFHFRVSFSKNLYFINFFLVRDDNSALPIKMFDFKVPSIPDCYLIIECLRSLLYVYKAKSIQSHLLNSLQPGDNMNSFNGKDYLYLRGIYLKNAPENYDVTYTDDFVNIGMENSSTISSILGPKNSYFTSWKYHTFQTYPAFQSLPRVTRNKDDLFIHSD